MQESVVKPEQAIEELIIRIDENNKIIGSTTRKEMVIWAYFIAREELLAPIKQHICLQQQVHSSFLIF